MQETPPLAAPDLPTPTPKSVPPLAPIGGSASGEAASALSPRGGLAPLGSKPSLPPVAYKPPPAAPEGGELPAGWREKKTADGRTYYYAKGSTKTQWERPTEPAPGAEGGGGSSSAAAADDTPLPEGWRAKTLPDGRTYYYAKGTKQTQWTRPTEPAPQPSAE